MSYLWNNTRDRCIETPNQVGVLASHHQVEYENNEGGLNMAIEERVRKGEKYWFISVSSFFDSHIVMWRCDMRGVRDDKFFNGGNYFHTKEEAGSMAHKLRAVLNGADVIEMPSEEDIEKGT